MVDADGDDDDDGDDDEAKNHCFSTKPGIKIDTEQSVPQNLSPLSGADFGPKFGTTPHGSDGFVMIPVA